MTCFTKHTIQVFLAVVLIASMASALPLTAFGEGEEPYEGAYEGEYDANGKRSGYGTWAYYNDLYVGNWENDMPNGEGTLYRQENYKRDGKSMLLYYIAHGNWVNGYADGIVEWTSAFDDSVEVPQVWRTSNVQNGEVSDDQFSFSSNTRRIRRFPKGYPVGAVAPFCSWSFPLDTEIGTPWHLYEKYPPGTIERPLPKIENTGMENWPGNLRIGIGYSLVSNVQMAALGDWIFLCMCNEDEVTTIYKMRADGSQMLKLYEQKMKNIDDTDWMSPEFKVIGDWLYISSSYKMQADDYEFVKDMGDFEGPVIDEWVYTSDHDDLSSLVRVNLDYTVVENLGKSPVKSDGGPPLLIFKDENWLYFYFFDEVTGEQELQKMKHEGSGEIKIQPMERTHGNLELFPLTQIISGRIYYTALIGEYPSIEFHLRSVDIDFLEAPITVARMQKHHLISRFNFTDDHIFYGDWNSEGHKDTTSLIRINHDGSDPAVLVDEMKGYINAILIAGDWIMFGVVDGNNMMSYIIRQDGSDLHKLGDPFIPSNAPGITDSTGKWRYELLEDGSAIILGAGSKLKQTGKLSIPATVDKIPVTAIGENAFYGCEGFTGVTIPKSVTSIGDFAFFWCKGLTGVTIPEGVTHIGKGAFQWCTKVKKVTLPASLTSVGSGAFANCPTVKLSVAKKNEVFEIRDGVLFDKVGNKPVY